MTSSLLAGLTVQDPEAWRRVVRLYYPLVRHWCQRTGLQPDDAGDVAQEVFRILAGAIGRFQHDGGKNSFRGWLWGITRNAAQHRTTFSLPKCGNILIARSAMTARTSLPTETSNPASSTESLIMTLPSSV